MHPLIFGSLFSLISHLTSKNLFSEGVENTFNKSSCSLESIFTSNNLLYLKASRLGAFLESPHMISGGSRDNEVNELLFSSKVNSIEVPSTFTSTGENSGDIQLDLSTLTNAGLFNTEIIISDGSLSNSDMFTTWLISNKTTVTINQDDNPDDGFDGGAKTQKDYYVYYLVGGDASFGRTDYLFVADSLEESPTNGTSSDLENFRE